MKHFLFMFQSEALEVKRRVLCNINYKGIEIECGYKIDLLVNDLVIVQLKSVEEVKPVHHLQLLTYLKLSSLKLGLPVNFNTDDLGKSIYRKVNKL